MSWVKDPKTGKQSVTLTMFVSGFIIAMVKLLFSGMDIAGFKIENFSGSDFAAVVGALGAVYALRKHTDKDKVDG